MIIRSEKKSNYTILPNEFLLDDTISDKARGVLARLLCRPDNWNLNVTHLIKTGKTGQVAIRSAIKELEEAGYLEKDVVRDQKSGRIIGVEYVIRECPGDALHDVDAHSEPDHFSQTFEAGEVVEDADVQVEETDHEDLVHIEETAIKETAPIINTDTKQILKETTTTTPGATDQGEPDPAVPSSSCSSNQILNLIPEKHKSPVVVTLVNKAMVEYPENEIKQALAYAGANVRGGSLQFKAYLDKTLKNGWAEGWAPEHDTQGDKQAAREQFEAMPDSSLRMLAGVGNFVAIEELKRRESRVGHVGTC